MNFSYWEVDFRLKNIDFAVVGGGIVGLSSAYHIKKRFPDSKVVVIERDFLSAGASSRNAGFACFGSPSEIISDALKYGWDSTLQTLDFRRQGLELLQSLIPLESIQGSRNGGYEIFQEHDKCGLEEVQDHWQELQIRCRDHLGFQPYHWTNEKWGFQNVQAVAYIDGEGMLHPGLLLGEWMTKCRAQGVDIMHGLNIDAVNVEEGFLRIRDQIIACKNIVLCTNGLTSGLLDGLDVYPARNQVLVTEEILPEIWNSTFHQRAGYVYFRSIGKRVLIGGGRDLFAQQEETSVLEVSDNVREYLTGHLCQLLGKSEIKIDYHWSGIMGLGNGKGPIIQKVGKSGYVAVRMGGMGVAIGTWVGKRLSEIIE